MSFRAWLHRTRLRALPRWRRPGIAARLYGITALLLTGTVVLVGVSVHLAWRTQAATMLLADAVNNLIVTGDIRDMVERTHQLVQTAPALFDPDRVAMQADRANDGIRTIITMVGAAKSPGARQVEQDLPDMAGSAEQVFNLATAGLHGQAADVAEGAFAAAFLKVEDDLVALRKSQRDRIRAGAVALETRATTSVPRVVADALTVGTLGLLMLAVAHGVLRRLTRITATMVRLARGETDLVIPSLGDPDDVGHMAAAVAVFQANARELEQTRRKLGAALNNMSDGLTMVGPDGRLLVINRRMSELFGCREEHLRPGMSLADMAAMAIEVGCYPEAGVEQVTAMLRQHLSDRTPAVQTLSLPQREERSARILSVRRQPMEDGGMVCTYEDITERQQTLARINHMARHDALTGLANRTALTEEIEHALRWARRGEDFAVLSLDLDRFKQVNDTLGHPVGDSLLRLVAQRLSETVREVDTVARLGGDEFVVVQTGGTQPMHAKALAARLTEVLGAPYAIDGHQVIVGISIGIALSGSDFGSNTVDLLLRRADLALYRAKQAGGGDWRFFAPEMEESAKAWLTMELDLRAALEQAQFELRYQPMISVQERRVSGFEALLRWHHPTRGLVPPAEFIPFAEGMGLIVPIGDWVLKTACREAARWQAGQPDDKCVRIAVNVSTVQFANPRFVESVRQALDEAGLVAGRLELEITECVRLHQGETTLSMLHRLRAMGVRISMDDFGTGYSSLSYLRLFPFDKIKIDHFFVRDLVDSDENDAIVRAVAALAATLRITTLAEGVETAAQVEHLVADGCDELQGFFFSPALPGDQVPNLLAEAQAGWPRWRGLVSSGDGGVPPLTADASSPRWQRRTAGQAVATPVGPWPVERNHGLEPGVPT
jgi:diguanylate cyclase (GGDEF)-like protein